MSHATKIALLIGALCIVPAPSQAGWVTEWEQTPIKSNGDRGATETATMQIEKGKVRLAQTSTTSLIDYNKSRFAILNPEREYFWSGTIDEYVAEMTKAREQALKRRGERTNSEKQPEIDPKSLPPVVVTKTEEAETIAGHPTQKYEVRVNNELFEELWIADDLDLSSDLDAKKLVAYQRKMSAAMQGNSAKSYNAVYYSPDYQKLLEKGFALRSITHHIAGAFERKATQIKQVEIPGSEFEVPQTYRRVRLNDVFPTGKTS